MIDHFPLKHRITAVFLALLLMGYVGNISFFMHEHEVGDIKIVHSHPYSSSSHNHTTNAITAISLLSHVVALAELSLGGLDSAEQLLCVLEQDYEQPCYAVVLEVISLRGPPVL